MLALYLIAAHMVGDFLLQDRWTATFKQKNRRALTAHVAIYLIPFSFILTLLNVSWPRACGFLAALGVAHWLTDARRFRSTLGDCFRWWVDYRRDKAALIREWITYRIDHMGEDNRTADVTDNQLLWPTPNPWFAASIMIDQTLHFVQLAVLGAIFL